MHALALVIVWIGVLATVAMSVDLAVLYTTAVVARWKDQRDRARREWWRGCAAR